MTEDKRFEIKQSVMDNNRYVIHDSKKEYTFPVLDSTLNYMFCKALNELSDENEELKQFKEKVFTLINKEIAQNEEAIGWGKETGADSSATGFYNHMLKRLKKELEE